ncbi:glycoside hydrolase family 16 protein [Neolewinella aurantiaca]|uniref:Glycoside hydrolase family 16 protein n=1 Tax=Neolewinella aurantiaca TaxID=2602767 RepID=A0A5C7FRP8_9BACT|nr:glycoside hydrolase family 16 protein [Neolewinella aurantiaca]TXF88167.1 glycoside hydrolase family 16 protein [Neolewinella aurantiaca]
MRNLIIVFLFCLTCCVVTSCKSDGSGPAPVSSISEPAGGGEYVPDGYKLVWADEFETPGLPDTTRWGYQTGGHGWTAKERQLYTEANPDNVRVQDGMLSITAQLTAENRRNPFSSTRLVTKYKATFEEGYFEIRAKFPEGDGLRSAFWMVGDTVSKIGWPKAGEIDLVEHYGKFPTVVGAAVQTPDFFWSGKGQKGGSRIVKSATTEFHVYSCEWTKERLTFAVDGEEYWTYEPLPGRAQMGYPFAWPFYLVANVSVGGLRGPETAQINTGIFPASMYLDYVRVYQK